MRGCPDGCAGSNDTPYVRGYARGYDRGMRELEQEKNRGDKPA
jgi:hypothetical protein